MRYVDIHTHRPTGRHIEPSAAGIHPWNVACEGQESLRARLAEGAEGADAIGETGLDMLHRETADRQREVFREHLRIACELGKPVILHCVRAFEEVMTVLADYHLRAVVFHGFIGSAEQARRALEHGCYLSFGARSLRSPKTVEVLRTMPLNRLFLETDDGDTPIENVYAEAAEIRNITVGELQTAILDNYKRLFKKNGL